MNIKKEIYQTLLIIIVGIISHFLYEWSNHNVIIGLLSPVNESIWEHLKLIFFPMLIPLFFNFNKNYFQARIMGILSAILFLVLTFYTYSGIIGDNYAIVNIILYVLSILLGQFISYLSLQNNIYFNITVSIIIFLTLLICFIIFTFYPPRISMFQDPISCTYGILKHS